VEENENLEAIESKLGVGPITEVLEQARDELDLIPHMVEWQPWNMGDGQGPVKIELID
jgi:NADH dehydrogenase (ubiquinone) 1 alpha subcomplex subunit 5